MTKMLTKPAPLTLFGRELPWVEQADHLGCTITSDGEMEQDAAIKRAKFIASSSEVREVFKFAAPLELIRALKIYSSSFYGSSLWDLGGEKAHQVYSAWDSAVKLVWGCPIWTRTYILHNLLNCGQSSARVDIIGRYESFYKGLRDSASHEVRVVSRYVARDVRTTTGKNLGLLRSLTGLNPHSVSTSSLKSALEDSLLVPVPEQDAWRIEYLCKLITDRRTAKAAGNQTDEQRYTELINSLVKN